MAGRQHSSPIIPPGKSCELIVTLNIQLVLSCKEFRILVSPRFFVNSSCNMGQLPKHLVALLNAGTVYQKSALI